MKCIAESRFCWCVLTSFLVVGFGSTSAGAQDPDKIKSEPFIILPEGSVHGDSFGMAMVCPAHAHGTPADALKKLKDILGNWPTDKVSSIWVCRANLLETLRVFSPLVDRVVVNPFALSSKKGPTIEDSIWPGFDHSCINNIRQLRINASGKKLLACINLNGEPHHF